MPAHDEFRIQLDQWSAELLDPYIERLQQIEPLSISAKEFNDPVWGTIVLHPVEVLVLDSPLLQRLRHIRQLGVVHLVYTGAEHTRLEHSVGVVHQVDRLVESINEHDIRGGDGSFIGRQMRQLLRLTALSHDVGHGAMSHVSELALKNFDEVERIRDDFSLDPEIDAEESVPLSEIASYFILNSDSFCRLVDLAASKCAVDLPQDACKLMANAVIGSPIDDRVPLLHELISGPFDADKLDYMTRDAHMTGVPVVTDVPRLIQKVRAVEVAADELPRQVSKFVQGGLPSYIFTGLDQSGGRTLDELMFGRVLLHDKLYRHQKVRAAEAMVSSMFKQFGEFVEGGPAMAAFKLDDADLLNFTPKTAEDLAGRQLRGNRQQKQIKIAEQLSRCLKNRDLFVRAYAFSRDMPLDPYRAIPEHYESLEEVIDRSRDPEYRGVLVSAIADAIVEALSINDQALLDKYGNDIKPFIWIDPPPAPPPNSETTRAWLINTKADRQILPFREAVDAVAKWSDAYLLTRDLGYVFTIPELAKYAYVATELVLRRDHSIRTPESMLAYSKFKSVDITTLKRSLVVGGFYKGLPNDIKPKPERLTRADIKQRIDALRTSLHQYEGPVGRQADSAEPLLSDARILDWVRQFDERFEDEPLSVLEELQLVSRETIVERVKQIVDESDGVLDGAAICPLGTAKDSASVVAYYANDLRGHKGLEVKSLAEALIETRPVVFVDDFIGSGSQSISILEAWLGVDPTTDLDEERGGPLSDSSIAALTSRKLGFVFAAGKQDGISRLLARTQELSLDATVLNAAEYGVRQAFNDPMSARRAEFRSECERIGFEILRSQGREEEWCRDRSLGYGNDAFLTITPYNTPAQTLTCLWASGTVDGLEWMPLVPRRKKH